MYINLFSNELYKTKLTLLIISCFFNFNAIFAERDRVLDLSARGFRRAHEINRVTAVQAIVPAEVRAVGVNVDTQNIQNARLQDQVVLPFADPLEDFNGIWNLHVKQFNPQQKTIWQDFLRQTSQAQLSGIRHVMSERIKDLIGGLFSSDVFAHEWFTGRKYLHVHCPETGRVELFAGTPTIDSWVIFE